MATPLTPQDVARLLSEPSSDVRAEVAGKVAAALTESGLGAGEVALAQDIVRVLARDVESKVRAALAHGLRNAPDLPADVARTLAADIDTVALPFLAETLVLTDDDLIALVRAGSPRKQSTIAARPNLTESVTSVLIDHAAEPAVAVLMGNPTANIHEASLNRAVTRFAASDHVKQAMVLRHSLPMTVAERLAALVSAKLQEHLVAAHALPPGVATDIVLRGREHAIIHLSMGASQEELSHMVAQMHHGGRLTPTLMLRALCTGDIAFFEAAMAVRGGVPVANAQILIHEPSRRGLIALYRRAAMPDELYAAVLRAVEVVDDTRFDGNPRDLERFRARVISRVLTESGSIGAEDALYLADKLGEVLTSPTPAPDGTAAAGH